MRWQHEPLSRIPGPECTAQASARSPGRWELLSHCHLCCLSEASGPRGPGSRPDLAPAPCGRVARPLRGSRGQRVGSQVESAGWVIDKCLFEYQTETFRLGWQGQPTRVGRGGEAARRQGARPAPRRAHPVGTRPLGAQSAGVPTQGRQQQPHKHPRPRMGNRRQPPALRMEGGS